LALKSAFPESPCYFVFGIEALCQMLVELRHKPRQISQPIATIRQRSGI